MRNTPAIEELDLYVWEGKADIVDRVARCMASFDVEVIRADNAEVSAERAALRPSLAITTRRSIRPSIRISCRSTSRAPNCAA